MPTFGSLFAGIGGIDLGLERAGWECRFQVEWDAYCQRVLAKHWPDVPRYGDITAVDWSGVERVDLLAGGFPCQPVSVAGYQRAQDDERWLWPDFLGAIRALRPRLVLVENVPNLLAVAGGSAFGDVIGGLADIGYDAEWSVVSACAVGAPHMRRRLFIVAYPHGEHGRAGIWDTSSRQRRAVQAIDRLEGARAGWGTRLENPSALYRDADGLPDGMDRNHAIGNAVVPQVVEVIGLRLLASLEQAA